MTVPDVPEALEPQVAQLRATRANAVAYGQTDIIAAVDRQLAALGIEQEKEKEESEAPKQAVPQGRTAVNPKQTVADPGKDK
jgi:hypothetical protein